MYTKKEILDEMKRVAEKLGVKILKREEFEQNTTIPNDTLRFYLSSWDQALKDAGMTPGKSAEVNSKREPQSDEELLAELARLYEETGETPTPALINSRGRYAYRQYSARWKSLEEALNLAIKNKRTLSSDSGDFNKKLFSSLSDFSDLGIYQEDIEEIGSKLKENNKEKSNARTSSLEIPFAADISNSHGEDIKEEWLFPDKDIAEILASSSPPVPPESPVPSVPPVPSEHLVTPVSSAPTTIKLIPKTIKPKIAKKKPMLIGEAINFRGIKFAPVDAVGVGYLFGLINRELGFVLETFRTMPPGVEGKRCIDMDNDRWEKVKLDIVYKSSDFNSPGYNEMETDIIICWCHDWKDCPVEVLELRSISLLMHNKEIA